MVRTAAQVSRVAEEQTEVNYRFANLARLLGGQVKLARAPIQQEGADTVLAEGAQRRVGPPP